jgi:transcription antitermination factor NusG
MKRWYVLNTKPKKEFHVEKIFMEAGFRIYNPKYKHEERVKPFFTGYEFICFDFPDQYQLDGLIELLKYGEEPVLGDEIEVVEGPLKGLKGIFERELSDADRVLILLNYVSYQGQLVIEKKKLKKIL